ncbi:hypothetical protein KFL_009560030 [Klebsormidium nitens]|uniref:HMG domain-containing protein n=1 Tax=Klebsormidium nitens TaxID=105231 RepID=A0A1Y1IU89_KLENI|nr:hypothetical protein KFL_009560030 [Klebsormidium nitens]|eukprot:GAQ92247.1 hypothetical protein KFL_009560030 [Klebsormidium nitens]
MGSTCLGKNPIYARGQEPFIWERKRNRGGAIICPGAGGHLLCLRCVEAEYVGGRPFVSKETGCVIPQGELVTKFELYPKRKELHQAQPGKTATEGGHQFFVQRRDLAPCPYCTESKAISKRGVKRPLEEGTAPSELGPMSMLLELQRSKVPPTAVAPGLFLVPQLASDGRLLDILVTDKGLMNVPRLVRIDHMGKFACVYGQRAYRGHETSFLEETRFLNDWWQGGLAKFTSFNEGRSFVHEVTREGVQWVLPLDQWGRVGAPLYGLDAEAWGCGPQLRVFVVCDWGEQPVVCVLGGKSMHCSHVDCNGADRCRHLSRVLSELATLGGVEGPVANGAQNGNGPTLAKRRAERLKQQEAGLRRLLVCNKPVCRRPDFKGACTHQGSLELWECSPAAALDMGHSHKKIDTVMSRGGVAVTSLCERWGEAGTRQRDEAQHFCAPRPCDPLSPCDRSWKLESRKGSLFAAGARYDVTTLRRVCRIAPGREAACCSLAYDGQEDGIFNFSGHTLIPHGLLLRNHFAAALGASHSLNFEANDMATKCLEGPGVSRLDDRVFDSAMQAFNDLAARARIQHVCSRANCAHLYTSEVEGAEREARKSGNPLRAERTEGPSSDLSTYAFGQDKVVTFDGTFFANSSAMRDSSEASLHSICEPDPAVPRVAGGFTPLSVGGVRPSNVPLERIDCPWKYRNGLSELRPAVRNLAFRWCNFRKAPGQGSNAPLSAEEFVTMREGLPLNVRALIDHVTESGACPTPDTCAVCKAVPRRPWMQGFLKEGPVGATGWCPTHFQPFGALLHALLIPRYSWVFGRIVTLKLLRHLLLEGPLDERGVAYLSEDGPMLAAILRHRPVGSGLYAFPGALRPLFRDIYATNLLCFEPSANRPFASSQSPLAALHDATEHLWALEREKLRLVGQQEGAAMEYAEQRGVALKRAANSLLFELEDWEDEMGRGKKGSEERLSQHCSAPNPRPTKGRAGFFVACCQDRGPLGYHWLKGGESVSDLGTVLLTRFPFKTLRGLTIVEDAACNAQEWLLNRVPQLAKFMLFLVDRFHSGPVSCAPSGAKRYATHTCSPTLFIDSFPQHRHTITTASEGINSGLKRCAASLQQITSIKRLLSRVTTILDTLFERSKYAVYWSQDSNPLRDSIKMGRG